MENETIKREVKRKGGVAAVSTALGVSTAAVYYWISGKRQPSDKLLNYLGLQLKQKFVRQKAVSE